MTDPSASISGPGRAAALGVTPRDGGCDVAVFSGAATRVALCVFSADGAREIAQLPLPERSGDVWHGHVAGLRPGDLYGLRADGPWDPARGLRFNPAKLLLDPYARALSGRVDPLSPLLTGHSPGVEDQRDPADSAPAMARCVVTEDAVVPDAERPRTPWSETVIYEAHVRGLTMTHPGVPEALRGTYEGLACPAILDHLRALGVTALELLPIHAFLDDARLARMGLRNYWGYNTLAFFAPEPRYFGPGGAAGLRAAIRALHQAGIEVILDVVYNHTAEGDQRGPTLGFRGLDNHAYHRLPQGRPRGYVNDTGCGNTLRAEHPFALRLILDSLRHWVSAWGVDGFRFDLATALAREPGGFDPEGGFLDALRQDPILRDVKLIAEPWDIGPGGYQLGGFPPPFAEWNDGFRDTARRFWRGDDHAAQDLAERLLGSAQTFDRGGRRAWSSVNFVACHDGFTLADATAYAEKRNHANGEDNRDGHGANFSDGCGAEGPTEDAAVLARRAQRRRCLLATVALSQGAPMLLAGDELGNGQDGNNNAYCQDNPIGWVDWPGADAGLLAFARRALAFRAAHPVLRQTVFLHGERRRDGEPDVVWRGFDGGPPNWRDPGLSRLCLVLRPCAEAPAYRDSADAVFIALNGGSEPAEAATPLAPRGRVWMRALDAAAPDAPPRPAGARETIAAAAVVAFHLAEIGA